jgi:cell division protein FtsL
MFFCHKYDQLKNLFMKSKLCIVGLVFASLLIYSCSNDDSYEVQDVKSINTRIHHQSNMKNLLKEKVIDSTAVINKIDKTNTKGEPSNPIPPRKGHH